MEWLFDDPSYDGIGGEGDVDVGGDDRRKVQRWALGVLYFYWNGEEWTNSDGWMEYGVDECEWRGITCDDEEGDYGDGDDDNNNINNNRAAAAFRPVSEMNLPSNNLGGTTPRELSLLSSNFRKLILSSNSFVDFSPQFGKLDALRILDLGHNAITGSLPDRAFVKGRWSYLEELRLEGNRFEDTLPASLGLSLGELKILDLGGNRFGGALPKEWGNLHTLVALTIDGNTGINGTVPAEFGDMISLKEFYLDGTSVSGSMPEEVCQLFRFGGILEGDCPVDTEEREWECSCCTNFCNSKR